MTTADSGVIPGTTLVDKHPRRGVSRARVARWLVAAIIALSFLNPVFLKLQNADEAYSGVGFGSLLGPVLILLSWRRIVVLLLRVPRSHILVWFPISLVPGALAATLFLEASPRMAVSYLVTWTAYAGLALAVAAWAGRLDWPRVIFRVAVPTVTILLGLSLVKHYSGLPIPVLNEVASHDAAALVQLGDDPNDYVAPLLGPFLDRTQAAMLLEGVTAFILGYIAYTQSRRERRRGLVAFAIVCVFMLHSTNRSFFVSLALATVMLLASSRWSSARTVRRWIPVLLVALVAGVVVLFFFPTLVVLYTERLIAPLVARDATESGQIRVALWSVAWDGFRHGWNLFGAGPLGIPVPLQILADADPVGYRADTHSNFVFFLWRGGLFGVVWLLAFFATLGRALMRTWQTADRSKAMMCLLPIVAAFGGGVAHTTLPEKQLWVFIGVFLGTMYARPRHEHGSSRSSERS